MQKTFAALSKLIQLSDFSAVLGIFDPISFRLADHFYFMLCRVECLVI